jgi:signal peptidase II
LAETADISRYSAFRNFLSKEISVSAAHLLFWPVFLLGLAADLWTKSYVFHWLSSLPSYPRYSVFPGFFEFVLVENRGAAWGIASDRTIPLVLISIFAIIIVFTVFLLTRKPRAVVVFSLGLFAAGVCGNLYDRLFNAGKVRDFLDFYYRDVHFPAFNIADSMLTIAVFLVTIFCSKSPTEDNVRE